MTKTYIISEQNHAFKMQQKYEKVSLDRTH